MRVSARPVVGLDDVPSLSCFRAPAASFLLFAEDSADLDALGDKLSSRKCVFLRAMEGVCNFGGGRAPGISIGDGSDPGRSMPLCDCSAVKPF